MWLEIGRMHCPNICMKLFTDIPWSTCSRLVQKKWENILYFSTETLGHCWPFRRPAVGLCPFWPLAPVLWLVLNKKSGNVTLFHCRGQYDTGTKYQVCDVRIYSCCLRHSWRTKVGAMILNLCETPPQHWLYHIYTQASPWGCGWVWFNPGVSQVEYRVTAEHRRSSCVCELMHVRFAAVAPLLLDRKSHSTVCCTDEIEHLKCTLWDKHCCCDRRKSCV